MDASSYHLPAMLYRYFTLSQGRYVPFEELCTFITLSGCNAENESEILPVQRASQTRIMDSLIFLSNINLIRLDPDTDESCLNYICSN